MDGIFNIDKPAGITSAKVVARIKRCSGERHAGHAGTLDPDATGVLPVCLGRGTRIVEFITDTTKTYRAGVELGVTTDTYDASGRITRRADASGIDRPQVEQALDGFRGNIQQVPPLYSAVKHRGKPLYKLARAGIEVEIKSRPVTIHRLKLTGWRPPVVSLEIECGKGTYIRSLAHDLGNVLGCGGHLKSLVRTRCGIFNIDDAVPLSQLEESFENGQAEPFLHPIDSVLQHLGAIELDEAGEETIRNGRPLPVKDGGTRHEYCRAYSQDGRFLAVLRHLPDKGVWQPKKVLV